MFLAALIIGIILLLFLAWSLWLTFAFVGLVLHLFIAGLIGALADALMPGNVRWGWFGAMVAGLLGSWLGVLLLGRLGPALFGVRIIPAFVGALLLAVIWSLLVHRQARLA